jgi:hypothetical protein
MLIMKIPFHEILQLYSSTVKISVEEECHIKVLISKIVRSVFVTLIKSQIKEKFLRFATACVVVCKKNSKLTENRD